MKALEWLQHYALIFRRSRAANSVVDDWILPKFTLIQAFIAVLVAGENEEDPLKMKAQV